MKSFLRKNFWLYENNQFSQNLFLGLNLHIFTEKFRLTIVLNNQIYWSFFWLNIFADLSDAATVRILDIFVSIHFVTVDVVCGNGEINKRLQKSFHLIVCFTITLKINFRLLYKYRFYNGIFWKMKKVTTFVKTTWIWPSTQNYI